MAGSTAALSRREQILSLLPTTPPVLDCDIIKPENLEHLIDPDKVNNLSQQVLVGRQAREYVLAQERRVNSLSKFCHTVFYSYLPQEMKTEALREVFLSKYHRLDPEIRIAMYEKWLADLPYRAFSHLTAMVVDTYHAHEDPALPPEIERFSHLTELAFSYHFFSIPDQITKLANLTTLNLQCYSGNNFQENLRLCRALRALPRLEKIIFSEDSQLTGYSLQNEFPRIKIEYQKLPERTTWSPL